MSRHTKGPWHVGAGNGTGSIFADNGRMRMEEGGTTLYPICKVQTGFNMDEDAANARLIAAAPELLDSLLGVLTLWEDLYARQADPGEEELWRAAKNAIAKAVGG